MKIERFILIIVFFTLPIYNVFGQNDSSKIVASPAYTVTLSMTNSNLYRNKEQEIGFIIMGYGNYDKASITITSDAINIKENSLYVSHATLNNTSTNVIKNISSQDRGTAHSQTYAWYLDPLTVNEGTIQRISGSFKISTIDGALEEPLSVGDHYVKMNFIVNFNDQNYIFSDEVKYKVTSHWEENKSYVIPVFWAVVLSIPANIIAKKGWNILFQNRKKKGDSKKK